MSNGLIYCPLCRCTFKNYGIIFSEEAKVCWDCVREQFEIYTSTTGAFTVASPDQTNTDITL